MKKIISLLLAMIMVFSLATVAFAEDEVVVNPNYTDENMKPSEDQTTIKLKKLFTITGATNVVGTEADEAAKVYPHETLSFEVEGNDANPTDEMIVVADWTVNGPNGEMAITLPNYTEVGRYEYTVTETASNAQGAFYSTGKIGLSVLVEYNENHDGLKATLVLTQTTVDGETQTSQIPVTKADGTQATVAKVDTFLNTYKVGHLDVTKEVEGNLASRDQEFKMTVTFTSTTGKAVKNDITVVDGSTTEGQYQTIEAGAEGWTTKTHDIYVKHGETVSFYNIPEGVTYTVVESADHLLGENDTVDPNGSESEDYTVAYDGKETGTIANQTTSSTTVTNTKNTSVETGIALDSAPYFVILAVAMFGMVALVSKKRYEV